MDSILSSLINIGAYRLKNRVVMAPLTRMRAGENSEPTELNAEYYGQRASAGLMITEATQISRQGQGYPGTPGIYTVQQIEGWKQVTQAVHDKGGLIFIQLWHVGRISHSSFQPEGKLPVAPSAIAAAGNAYLPDFSRAPYEVPQELTVNEIKTIVDDYRKAAENAREAGFDGVEIHAANGYLIEQFLRSVSNHRSDKYGGNIENRSKFLFEVLEAVLSVWTNDRVGVRISPLGSANIIVEPDPFPLYDHIVKKLGRYNLAYLHIIESRESVTAIQPGKQETILGVHELSIKHFRKIYSQPIIAAGGFNKQKAEETIAKGYADAIAFGRQFISTPDLPYRLINGINPNEFDPATAYGGGSKGYTDYKTLNTES